MLKFSSALLTFVLVFQLVLADNKMNFFKPQDVLMLPSVFDDAMKIDLKYVLSLDPDKLLAPFRREAGLNVPKSSYSNWENTGLDGHIAGHYLSALSLLYANTGDLVVFERLNYMIDELEKCQLKNGNGYIGGVPGSNALWNDIANAKIKASSFDLNNKWVPLYNIHKTYAGLRDAYVYTANSKALHMFVLFCDWMINITNNLTDDQLQYMLSSEHGGLNEVFADAAEITEEKKYLELAYRFSEIKILTPLINKVDKLDGMHANTQIPKIVGFKRIAQIGGDTVYANAARFFWETVVQNRSCVIGGNSVREHFHPINDFSSMVSSEQGPETCNTYNMLKLTKHLYATTGDTKFIEYYERALYNHILSTQHPQKGGFVYFTPMRPGHYRVYSQPQTSMWCCVGSGIENHAKYNELIYSNKNDSVFVNLFIPSKLNWAQKALTITQKTTFPESEITSLVINAKKKTSFSLNVRYPLWVANAKLKIRINNKPYNFSGKPGDYISISRNWRNGDRVDIELPMSTSIEQLPDGSNYLAALYGPIVLAAKTDTTELLGLFADDSRGGHIAKGNKIQLTDIPHWKGDLKLLASKIKPKPNKALTFLMDELIPDKKFHNMELVPFYTLHDSRYIIYWPYKDNATAPMSKIEINNAVDKMFVLDKNTIDMVACGEQQPESDHFIKSENSTNGTNNAKQWRKSTAWFSYILNDPNMNATKLYVSYSGENNKAFFKIRVNNMIVATIASSHDYNSKIINQEILLPKALIENRDAKFTIKFEAIEGSTTAEVFEIRLLK